MRSIYVVDDAASLALLYARSLERFSLPVRTFGTGEAFLESVTPESSGCVVLDMVLPGLDGWWVMNHMRQRSIDLPVIAVTGEPDVALAVEVMREGALRVLLKPFELNVLRAAVFEALVLDERRSRDRAARNAAARALARLDEAERETVELLCDGLTNRQVSYRIGCSVRTAERHRSKILRAFGVRTVAELVALLVGHGLLKPGPPLSRPHRVERPAPRDRRP